MHNLIKFLGIIFALTVVISCGKSLKETTVTPKKEPKAKVVKPKRIERTVAYEDFESFYERFHNDSVFQISRVKFPLQGYDMDTSETAAKWSRQNWIMHRSEISAVDTSEYKVEVQTDNSIRKERVYIEGGGFSSERVFKRIKGRWYLTLFINEEM